MKKFWFRDMIYKLKFRKSSSIGKKERSNMKIYIVFIIFTLAITWMFNLFDEKVKPTVLALSEAKAKVIVTYAINDTINKEIVSKVKYEDLVSIKKDSEGRVTALQLNVVKMNEMQALTTKIIQDKLSQIQESELRIPIGNIINSSVLSGWGPKIKIRIFPVGTVQANFNKTEFDSAGINQTRHRISLQVKGKVAIVVPFISTYSEVSTNIPVAETVIVGNVPETYLDVSDASDIERSRAEGIAPNLATKGN